jgi:hypothetical protein
VVFQRVEARLREAIDSPNSRWSDRETETLGRPRFASRYAGLEAMEAKGRLREGG